MILRIGLVTEGQTDQVVLRELLSAEAQRVNPALQLEFRALQPAPDRTSSPDATSAAASVTSAAPDREGGWVAIFRWCKRNLPPARAAEYFGRGLFGGALTTPPLDFLVVQMDADHAHHLEGATRYTSVVYVGPGDGPAARGRFVRDVLEEWLWPAEYSEPRSHEARHVTAPTVEAVEAWLIGALGDAEDDEVEGFDTSRCEARLAQLDARLRNAKTAPRRVNKSVPRYEVLARAAARHSAEAARRCPHFRSLCHALFGHLEHEATSGSP